MHKEWQTCDRSLCVGGRPKALVNAFLIEAARKRLVSEERAPLNPGPSSADGASFLPNMSADPFCVGAAAYDLRLGVWWCVVQVIRHEENLQVRHLVFRHSGDSAICDFAIRMRFMLRVRIAILRLLLYFAEQHARFC